MPTCNPAASLRRDGKKRIAGPPPQPSLPAVRQAILDHLSRPPPACCPQCGHRLREETIKLLRSEEHTSELQSLMRNSYAVFCLKKKKKHIKVRTIIRTT